MSSTILSRKPRVQVRRVIEVADRLEEDIRARRLAPGSRYLGTDGLEKIAVEAMSVDLFHAADQILDRVAHHQHRPFGGARKCPTDGRATDDKTLIVAETK